MYCCSLQILWKAAQASWYSSVSILFRTASDIVVIQWYVLSCVIGFDTKIQVPIGFSKRRWVYTGNCCWWVFSILLTKDPTEEKMTNSAFHPSELSGCFFEPETTPFSASSYNVHILVKLQTSILIICIFLSYLAVTTRKAQSCSIDFLSRLQSDWWQLSRKTTESKISSIFVKNSCIGSLNLRPGRVSEQRVRLTDFPAY